MDDDVFRTEESSRREMILFTVYKNDSPIGSLLLSSDDDVFVKEFKYLLLRTNDRLREQKAKRERARQDERKGRRNDEDIPIGG